MAEHNEEFKKIIEHIGHKLSIVVYGPRNGNNGNNGLLRFTTVTIECDTCDGAILHSAHTTSNEAGICAVCKNDNLEYIERKIDDDVVIDKWICKDCNTKCREISDIIFREQYIDCEDADSDND